MEGTLPPKMNEQISDFVHAFAYWGRLTTNSKENRVAICTNYAGIIQIYDCTKSDAILIKEHSLFLANYEENAGQFAPTPKTRWGYLSLDSNDNYIFALYSGLHQAGNYAEAGAVLRSNRIHVFDWNGNPVCQLLLDRKVKMICVDNFSLYGYDENNEDIVIANLNDVVL